jgi:hypothetical protein
VLEGIRGCSAHGENIATVENKSRTLNLRPQPRDAGIADPKVQALPQKAASGRLF